MVNAIEARWIHMATAVGVRRFFNALKEMAEPNVQSILLLTQQLHFFAHHSEVSTTDTGLFTRVLIEAHCISSFQILLMAFEKIMAFAMFLLFFRFSRAVFRGANAARHADLNFFHSASTP